MRAFSVAFPFLPFSISCLQFFLLSISFAADDEFRPRLLATLLRRLRLEERLVSKRKRTAHFYLLASVSRSVGCVLSLPSFISFYFSIWVSFFIGILKFLTIVDIIVYCHFYIPVDILITLVCRCCNYRVDFAQPAT